MNKQKALKEKGLKTTSARLAVLSFLEKQNNPIDVYTIVERLDRQADQATVYRILDILTSKGLVSRIELGEGKYRYELQKTHHHHLICRSCGIIEDIEGEFISEIEKEIRNKKGFSVSSHSLEFFGLCQNCQR